MLLRVSIIQEALLFSILIYLAKALDLFIPYLS